MTLYEASRTLTSPALIGRSVHVDLTNHRASWAISREIKPYSGTIAEIVRAGVPLPAKLYRYYPRHPKLWNRPTKFDRVFIEDGSGPRGAYPATNGWWNCIRLL